MPNSNEPKTLSQSFYEVASVIVNNFIPSIYNKLSGYGRLQDEMIKSDLWDDNSIYSARCLVGWSAGIPAAILGMVVAGPNSGISGLTTMCIYAALSMFGALQVHSLYQTGEWQSERAAKETRQNMPSPE